MSWPLSWWAVTPMPPDNVKGRPPVTSREGGPDANNVTITAASVTPGKGKRRLPTAYGSVYGPCLGRGMFAMTFRCPVCRGVHFGRSAEPVASGPRRSRCGTVWLVIGDDCRADTADLLRAFGDGWRCGLEARAERGTAA